MYCPSEHCPLKALVQLSLNGVAKVLVGPFHTKSKPKLCAWNLFGSELVLTDWGLFSVIHKHDGCRSYRVHDSSLLG